MTRENIFSAPTSQATGESPAPGMPSPKKPILCGRNTVPLLAALSRQPSRPEIFSTTGTGRSLGGRPRYPLISTPS